MKIYMLAATGGLEEPFFQSMGTDYTKALDMFASWSKEYTSANDGDRVDLIEIDSDADTTRVLKSA